LGAVNGTVVFENGRMTGALPGAFLTRERAAR
jgi:N-acyl-D-aspartate/D-glutamate deacylase